MSIQIRVPGDEGLYIPNEFLDSLMQPDVIKNALCKHFFEGNRDLMEKYWQTLKERELREFFRLYFGKTVEREERPFTFVVYGASGYTGSLVLEYIYRHVRGLGSEVTFALAGRTPSKLSDRLDEVLAKFPDATYRPEIFKADIANSMDIRKIVQKCLCVLNVAGPFIKTNAHLLVEACIDFDCDYVDVNGEVPFTHKLVPLHDWAKKKNVIICPNSAGAGGLPDLAAFFTAEELKKVTDAELKTLKCFITSNGGAPSGGTLATRAAMTAEMGKFVKIMGDPFALGGTVGDGKRPEDSDKVLAKVEYYPEFEGWSGPFTYAFYDTRLIRRSNWLMADLGEDPYGRHLSYSEHLLFPTEAVAKEITSANTSSKKEEEKLKKEGKLFKLGDGLAKDVRSKLFTDYYFHATAEDGSKIRTKISGGDGYDETARFAVEMTMLLTTRRKELPFIGGVLTPSVAGGKMFVDAVKATGVSFEVLEDDYKVDFDKIQRLV